MKRPAYPPPAVRPLLRWGRFAVAWSVFDIVGEATSVCFRFKVEFAIWGVLVVAPDETVGEAVGAVDEDDPWDCCCCWGIVLCCFCGEFDAEDGVFCGELMLDAVVVELPWGCVIEGGALEYNVPPWLIVGPFGVLVTKVNVFGVLLVVLPIGRIEFNGP